MQFPHRRAHAGGKKIGDQRQSTFRVFKNNAQGAGPTKPLVGRRAGLLRILKKPAQGGSRGISHESSETRINLASAAKTARGPTQEARAPFFTLCDHGPA